MHDALNRALAALADTLGRDRFVLERQPDGTWIFGAPSMLSYSPRPGEMYEGYAPSGAMSAAIRANPAAARDEEVVSLPVTDEARELDACADSWADDPEDPA